jgi:hypothetical protein
MSTNVTKYEFSGSTALPEAFDPSQQEGSSFSLLPVGEYKVEITEASINDTKNGSGLRLNATTRVLEGEHEGRYLFHGITITNPSPMAVDIGKKQLKDLCVACGITQVVEDVDIFKFKPFLAKVGIQSDKTGMYQDQNRITRVKPLTSEPQTPSGRLKDEVPY